MKALLSTLRGHWMALSPRDKNRAVLALIVCGLALLWWAAVSPALKTLRQADAQRQQLDAQLANMQAMAERAKALQNKPGMDLSQAAKNLDASVKAKLGANASLSVAGAQAQVNFKSVSPLALAEFLALSRSSCGCATLEARLSKGINPQGQTVWDGSLSLALPSQP